MSMRIPLVVLGILAVVGGYIPYATHFGDWVRFGSPSHEGLNWSIAATSTILAMLAISLAWFIYGSGKVSSDKLSRRFRTAYQLSFHKYYMDEFYLWMNHTFVDGLAKLLYWLELYFVEGAVNGIGGLPVQLGNLVRKVQTGKLQQYGLIMFGAILIVVVWLMLLNPLFRGALAGGNY